MKAWLQLSKAGDIISILPMLQEDHRRTGVVQNLVTCREYAGVAAGLDFVRVHSADVDWWDYEGGLRFAKSNFDKVVVTQCHGKDVAFQKHTPSALLDMWHRGGMIDRYDHLPLDIPFTRMERPNPPSIFLADHSQSAPFLRRSELSKLIEETFPNHQIIRASGMRMRRLVDFMPYMDAADLIVSVDTSILHLSAAVKTPVLAFVTASPETWWGTPWSRRFILHCRYPAFEMRTPEIVAAMKSAVNKLHVPTPEIYPAKRQAAYNMSIIRHGDKLLRTYRFHSGDWRTKLAIDDGESCLDIVFPKELSDYALEDGRLFYFNGELHLEYTVSRAIGGYFKCIQAYGRLIRGQAGWEIQKHLVPNLPGNDFSGMQKNYVPFEYDNRLFMIYGVKGSTQIVHELAGEKVVNSFESEAPVWRWGEIRGGCVLPHNGGFIRFFHSRIGQGNQNYTFRYYIGAALMEAQQPFRTVAVSKLPILAGNEKFVKCSHWKPNCALPYGAVKDGDDFVVSGGLNDSECFTLNLKESDLMF